MPAWRIQRNQSVFETDLFDVEVTDTANPFGNKAIAFVDDFDGTKFDDYPRGTRVDFFYNDSDSPILSVPTSTTRDIPVGDTEVAGRLEVGGTLRLGGTLQIDGSETNRFSGYVVERREVDKQGADSLEIEVYSFDQFLRRDTVSNDQTGNTITQALNDIITNDTPITYNGANVNVVDDQNLTQSFRGERVENALQLLRQKSAGEIFGVNDSLEFFFRPDEAQPTSRNIDNTQWTDYDIPERGKETVNQVRVFFDSGTRSVTVDNGADKLSLQDNLGTDDPIVLAEEVSRDDITDIDDARDVAEQILDGRSTTLTGTVTTFGLIDAEPGDIIDITINERGIDGNFRIAEIEYRWASDETVLTIVEKRGNQDDLLVSLSDTLKRVETGNVDRDATQNTITSTNLEAEIVTTGDVDGTSFDAGVITNQLRNAIRDGWAGDGNPTVADIAVGNGTSTPTRSDTALDNELERVSVSESLPDDFSVLYEGTFTETDIREIGLFESGGDLLARATVPDTTFSGSPPVDFTLTVDDSGDFENGVVTQDGQTAVRDVIADNTPALPTQYEYGSDQTAPAETDTSIGTSVTVESLESLTLQSLDTDAEWTGATSLADTDPVDITGNELVLLQSAFTQPDENAANTSGGLGFVTDSKYTNGSSFNLTASGDFVEWDFTIDYTISESDFEISVFEDNGDVDGFIGHEWRLTDPDDNTVTVFDIDNTGGGITLGWKNITGGDLGSEEWTGGDITPGTYTLRVEATDSTGDLRPDAVAPYDGRFNYTFDETTDGNGDLDGPELYPDAHTVTFDQLNTRRDADQATLTQTWNDTTNNQEIAVSNDGGANFQTSANTASDTFTFAGLDNRFVIRVVLSRFGTQTATPTSGINGQAIDDSVLNADIQAIFADGIGRSNVEAIVPPNTINPATLREAGELDASNNLLTRAIFADIDVEADERITSSERISFSNPN